MTELAEWREVDEAAFSAEILARNEPAVLRGLVREWPAVKAGAASTAQMRQYLARFDTGAPLKVFFAAPETEGRFFYRPDMDGFNFGIVDTRMAHLLQTLEAVAQQEPGERQAIYLGSTPVPEILPGFEQENRMPLLAGKPTGPRIWIGNRSVVAPHFDEFDNIACVVSGRRRFTLFPPEEVANLYIGPIDQTMAGQPSSMVDLRNPDFERFPRFRDALKAARVVDLEPGDAIFIPALWWHHVAAEGDLNVLINYWWSDAPADASSPMECLGHGLLAISHLPKEKRDAWRVLFDHYVFKVNGEPAEHIPPAARGILGESTPALRQMMKQFLLSALGRR